MGPLPPNPQQAQLSQHQHHQLQQHIPAHFLMRQLQLSGKNNYDCKAEAAATTLAAARGTPLAEGPHEMFHVEMGTHSSGVLTIFDDYAFPAKRLPSRRSIAAPEARGLDSTGSHSAFERDNSFSQPSLGRTVPHEPPRLKHNHLRHYQQQPIPSPQRLLFREEEIFLESRSPTTATAGAGAAAGLLKSKQKTRGPREGAEVLKHHAQVHGQQHYQQQLLRQSVYHQQHLLRHLVHQHQHQQQQHRQVCLFRPPLYSASIAGTSGTKCSCSTRHNSSISCSGLTMSLPPELLQGTGPPKVTVEYEASALSTRFCSSREAPPTESVCGVVGKSSTSRKSIQLLTGSLTIHDFYRVGSLLSVCSVTKASQQRHPKQQQEQQKQQLLEQQYQQQQEGGTRGLADCSRPLLYHAVTRDFRQEKRVLKVVKKKEGPLQADAEGVWRRICVHLLNLPPHPNVLSFEAVFETSDAFVFSSEQLEGGELFDFLLREKTVQEDVCQFIMLQILRAINHLHKHNLLHSSAAAASVAQPRKGEQETGEWGSYLSEDEYVGCTPPLLTMEQQHELLLIDCDTSMFIEDPLEDSNGNCVSRAPRRLVGTYGYLAPEVLKSGRYSCASDLWSVGVILYILMTGSPPLPMELMTSAKSALSIIKQITEHRGGIDFNAASFVEFPLAQDLCRRLLEVDPTKRIQTAEQAIQHPWLRAVNERPQSTPGSTPSDGVYQHRRMCTPAGAHGGPCARQCPHCTAYDVALVDMEETPGSGQHLTCWALPGAHGPFGASEDAEAPEDPCGPIDFDVVDLGRMRTQLSLLPPVGMQMVTADTGAAASTSMVAAAAATKSSYGTPSDVSSLESRRSSYAGSSSSSRSSNSITFRQSANGGRALLGLTRRSCNNPKICFSCSTAESGQQLLGRGSTSTERPLDFMQGGRSREWSCSTTGGATYSSSSSRSVGGSFGSPCYTPHFLSPVTAGAPHPVDACSSVSASPSCPLLELEVPLSSPLGAPCSASSPVSCCSSDGHSNSCNSLGGEGSCSGGAHHLPLGAKEKLCRGLVGGGGSCTALQWQLAPHGGSDGGLEGYDYLGQTLQEPQNQELMLTQLQQLQQRQQHSQTTGGSHHDTSLCQRALQADRLDAVLPADSCCFHSTHRDHCITEAPAAIDQHRRAQTCCSASGLTAEAAGSCLHITDGQDEKTEPTSAEAAAEIALGGICGDDIRIRGELSADAFDSDFWQYQRHQQLLHQDQEQCQQEQENFQGRQHQYQHKASYPTLVAACSPAWTIRQCHASTEGLAFTGEEAEPSDGLWSEMPRFVEAAKRQGTPMTILPQQRMRGASDM